MPVRARGRGRPLSAGYAGAGAAVAPFFLAANNIFFNQADYDAYSGNKTLGDAAGLVARGITDSGGINGTYTTAAGIITTKASGTAPRLNYVAGVLDSMVCEPAATNQCAYNTQIGGTTWNSGNSGSNTFAGTAPDGVTTWSRISFNAADPTSRIYAPLRVTTGSQKVTLSFYARSVSGTQPFRIGYFGDNTGTIVASSDLTATTTIQRFSATFTLGGTELGIYPAVLNSTAGLIVSANLEAWGYQDEDGAYLTSLILNTGATKNARTADAAAWAAAGITGFSGTGTYVASGRSRDAASATLKAYTGHPLANAPLVCIISGAAVTANNPDGATNLTPGLVSDALKHTITYRSQTGNFGTSMDGGAVASNSAVSAVGTATSLSVGNYAGNNQLIGDMLRVGFSATIASNAQLQSISAGSL